MDYKISKELLEQLINYMASKPFVEVFQLINALQEITKVSQVAETKETKDGNK